MTLVMFIFFFSVGSAFASLLTEAMKKIWDKERCSQNILALISAVIIGVFGSIITFILLDIPFDTKNCACIILMAFCIWLGSMVGYDKVTQTLAQLKDGGGVS